MKVYNVTGRELQQMTIVAPDDDAVNKALYHLLETSESLKEVNFTWDDFSLQESDKKEVNLDPGGMVVLGDKWVVIEVDGITFYTPSSVIYRALDCLVAGQPRIPGYIRSPFWYSNVVIPEEIHEKVINLLMSKSFDPEVDSNVQKLRKARLAVYNDGLLVGDDINVSPEEKDIHPEE